MLLDFAGPCGTIVQVARVVADTEAARERVSGAIHLAPLAARLTEADDRHR